MGAPRLLLSAILVLAGACSQGDSDDRTQYYLRFPSDIEYGHGRLYDTATVLVRTNLPEGTMATFSFHDGDGYGYHCCAKVDHGAIRARAEHMSCSNEALGNPDPPSSHFVLTVTVVPDTGPLQFECLDPDGKCENPQKPEVRRLLGPKFENVAGDQVTTLRGMRVLRASHVYPWEPCS